MPCGLSRLVTMTHALNLCLLAIDWKYCVSLGCMPKHSKRRSTTENHGGSRESMVQIVKKIDKEDSTQAF